MSDVEIEFVYFDLGNMLVSFDHAIALRNLTQRFGLDEQQAQTVIYDSGLQDRFEHGELSCEEFADQIRLGLGRSKDDMPTPDLLSAVSDMFAPIQSMEAIVRGTASQRRIGILSNTCHAHWDWIVKQNWPVIDGGFETHVLSYEVGAMKPDAKIYAAAQQAAGVPGERILFLDDRPENVRGAVDFGWQAVHCTGGDAAAEALRRLGVLP